jgi:glycine/D-amino acid oxidase-like deaminating enzyme
MKSAWEIEGAKKHPALQAEREADVCVLGGGLAGVWAAYLLAKEGKSVVLIEKDELGRAATLYTTGFITQVIDTDLTDLVRMYGEGKARLAWQAGVDATDQIESVAREEGIECEFVRLPYWIYARDRGGLWALRSEFKAARELGFDVAMIDEPIPGFSNMGALEVRAQAKYHPIKFFMGLVEAAEKAGVEIYEKTEAIDVDASVSGARVLTKSGYSIKARDVIVATYDPLGNPKSTRFKKGTYESYIYHLELSKGALPEMMIEDTHNPYHYVRVDDLGGKMRMLVGGEDHRAELKLDAGRSFRALKEYMSETFPGLDYEIKSKWHGAILEPSDGLPLIGEYSRHEYVSTAFSGNGMTYSALSGRILADLIMERGSRYKELYDPRRPLGAKPLLFKFRDYAGIWLGGAIKNLFK